MPPEEVDLVAPNLDVGAVGRQISGAQEPEQAALRFRARERGRAVLVEQGTHRGEAGPGAGTVQHELKGLRPHEIRDLSLLIRAPELVRRQDSGQVDESPDWS